MATLRNIEIFEAANPERISEWVQSLVAGKPHLDAQQIEALCHRCLSWHESHAVPLEMLKQGAKMTAVLAELNLDLPTLLTALCYNTVREAHIAEEELIKILPIEVIRMIQGVTQMDAVNGLRADYETPEQQHLQMNNVRQMLLAMVEDVRVVLIKLAEHLCLLESAHDAAPAQQRLLAQQAREIYAPLANRLGVGHIKWQLEDWSFRYLEPVQYKQIAGLIAEKRLDRQQAIKEVTTQLNAALKEDGIEGEVNGRVKHIYSIWNKMRRKHIQYEEVYDVRALRILVDKIGDCYAALGTVHRLWMHIPKEFDDYIAQPKANGYRSLHTAVIGPGGKALEVQIRTREMHQESELGVCAHWAYKETTHADPQVQHKVKWLRSLLEWQHEVTLPDDFLSEDRVYVFTPKGDVLDLPKGATPLDFAYHLHTELGHRTRGAKINGRIVPLTYQLKNGEQIEILSQKEPRPGRDWINPDSGFIYTSRARAKARSWFKQQHRDEHIHDGEMLLDKEVHRLGLPPLELDHLIDRFNFVDPDDLYAAIGRGDLRVSQVLAAAKAFEHKENPQEEDEKLLHPSKITHEHHASDAIVIEGVGNLLTVMAGCCHALPGDPITGYITHGRGVSIHRQDCVNILQVQAETPERIIAVDWGKPSESVYAVQIKILSYDRKNLLRDITSVFAHESVNVIGIESYSDKAANTVQSLITVEVPDLAKLARLLDQIKQLPNIISVQRVHQESSK